MLGNSFVDPHHYDNLDPHPESASNKNPDPHPDLQYRDKLDPDPHQFADDKPKWMEYEPILALFQGFEPLFAS
jgi:hypothetical protein